MDGERVKVKGIIHSEENGNLFQETFYFMILIYRGAVSIFRQISGVHSPCRFQPSCSEYAEKSVRRFGFLRGFYLGSKRIVRCHPWHEGGWDPVPEE